MTPLVYAFRRSLIFSMLAVLGPVCAHAQSGWYSPAAVSDHVNTLSFLDSLNGWMGGTDSSYTGVLKKTTDGGFTWVSQTLPVTQEFSRIVFITSQIGFAVGNSGVILKTTNSGETWLVRRSGGTSLWSVFFIDANNGWASGNDTVLITTDQGESWSSHFVSAHAVLWDIAFRTPQEGFAVGLYQSFFRTTDGGVTWNSATPPVSGRSLFGVCFPSLARGIVICGDQIALSTDAGSSWKSVYNSGGSQLNSLSFPDSMNGWVVGTDKIVKTSDGGASWHAQTWSPYKYLSAVSAADRFHAWAGGDQLILRTTTGGELDTAYASGSWIPLIGGRVDAVGSSPEGGLFAFTSAPLPTVDTVYRSIDSGYSWTRTGAVVPANVMAVCVNAKGHVFAGSSSGGVLRSTDDGNSWTSVNPSDLQWINILSLVMNSKDQIIAGYYPGRILRSTDEGSVWTHLKTFSEGADDMSLVVDAKGTLFVGNTYYSGGDYYSSFYCSKDSGDTWNRIMPGLGNAPWHSLAVNNDGDIFVGTYGDGVFRYGVNDTGYTSVNSGLTNTSVTALAISGVNLFAGTSNGIFMSSNNGASWADISAGLTNRSIRTLKVLGANIFACTHSGLCKRKLSEVVASTTMRSHYGAMHISLEQNYPNPFNPTTVVRYQLPAPSGVEGPVVSDVRLAVYDLLGREVAVLVHERKSPGSYEVKFDAAGRSSGVYFYRLTAGNFVQTRKMVVVK